MTSVPLESIILTGKFVFSSDDVGVSFASLLQALIEAIKVSETMHLTHRDCFKKYLVKPVMLICLVLSIKGGDIDRVGGRACSMFEYRTYRCRTAPAFKGFL